MPSPENLETQHSRRRLASLWLRIAGLVALSIAQLFAEVQVVQSASGWQLSNGEIVLKLAREAWDVRVESLKRNGGAEWVVNGSSVQPFVKALEGPAAPEWKFKEGLVTSADTGAKQLTLRFQTADGGVLSLSLRVYPRSAVVEFIAKLENRGPKTLPLISYVDPLSITLRNPESGTLKAYASVTGKHGFYAAGDLSVARNFRDWLVIGNDASGESAFVGGDEGLGVFEWSAMTEPSHEGLWLRAGDLFRNDRRARSRSAYDLTPGSSIELPVVFLALAKGDSDDAGNQAFRFLKHYIFPKPVPGSPQATYCVWLTEANSEEALVKEASFAKSVSFDVFYHDASWFEGSSLMPGSNNWTQGLGSYRENLEKFPHGLKALADCVRSKGMRFGIWVDPGNVDARRVESGEIPRRWLAMQNGQVLRGDHPSLSPTLQLCLGDPEVVDWIKRNLDKIIDQWGIEWLKWDPSGTVSYACDRVDHGHSARGGAYAAYRGHQEVLAYLLSRHPQLSGFEVDPSLRFSRTNPGSPRLLPGGYIDEFFSGPMLSPRVWGSFGTFAHGDVIADRLRESWYSASALDYHIRKHLLHGVSFGNINGMASQLLSAAPPGYIDALKRNLIAFRQYRELLFDDVYHPRMSTGEGWSAIQYVKEDASQSVVFVFRDKSDVSRNNVHLRGLDPQGNYRVASFNQQPGHEITVAGKALMTDGIAVELPNAWLAKGDQFPGAPYEDQLTYGSDILLLTRLIP